MGIYIKGMSIDNGLYQIANGKIFKYSSKGKPTKQYDVVEVRTPHKVHFHKRGWWIVAEDIGDCCYRCSNCGFIRDAYLLDVGKYCPNCGARMEEE